MMVDHQKKDKGIYIKITAEQRALLHDLSKSLGYNSLSKYMISQALSPVVFIKRHKPYAQFIGEVSKIGFNVNQIAKKVNTFDKAMDSDIEELKSEINEMKNIINLIEKDFREEEKFIRIQYEK